MALSEIVDKPQDILESYAYDLPLSEEEPVYMVRGNNPLPEERTTEVPLMMQTTGAPSALASNNSPRPNYSVDQAGLNLSGRPNMSTGPATPITSPGSAAKQNPRIVEERTQTSPAAGALLGGLLGMALNKTSGTSTSGLTPTTRPNTGGSGSGTTVNVGGGGSGGSGTGTGTGTGTGSTPTGNIGNTVSVQLPAGTTQAEVDAQYGVTNGQSNYVIAGVNSKGEIVATPNLMIGPNFGGNTSNQGTTGTGTNANAGGPNPNLPIDPDTGAPSGTTQIANNYFEDTYGNIYDQSGTLIYTDPNFTAGQSDPTQGGGGYEYFEDDAGNIYDSEGNLAYAFQNNYYYDPSSGDYFDYNFDPVGSTFNYMEDYYGYDPEDYPDWDYDVDIGDIEYEKNGGLVTPLFRKGGLVPRFAEGTTGGLDVSQFTTQLNPLSVDTGNILGVTNSGATTSDGGTSIPMDTTNVPTYAQEDGGVSGVNLATTNTSPLATASNLLADTGSTSSSGGVLDALSGILSNKGVSGALLGGLLTQLMNSSTQPVNKGIDMAALGALQPRTTNFGMGPAKFTPYSEYGTPTDQGNYSQLYQNLGVSPFNMGQPSGEQPTTSPTSGMSPNMPNFAQGEGQQGQMPRPPVNPTPDEKQPQYFEDNDGNIYDGNGNLVYDVTSGQALEGNVSPAEASVAGSPPIEKPMDTTIAPVQDLASSSLAVPPADSGYYSYGTPVNPADILKSKKGGLAKMADGGMALQSNLNVPVSDRLHPNLPTIDGRTDYRKGSYVEGPGDGQSDDIPAMLADGEYVIDAETVAQLGNGSNKAGAKMLDQFRENIREHKRSAPLNKIPPKSKSPLAYLKGAK
jgi:hypothetical protein